MEEPLRDVENKTGSLFGKLFPAYGDQEFEASVELFGRRFEINDFRLDWFGGKTCLDAGCGGGRYSIAMARLGALQAIGVDVGQDSIRDAGRRARAMGLTNVDFRVGSIERMPFPDASFDCVLCNGVLHHTQFQELTMKELVRVLRPGGMMYLLVYATEGLRWPMVNLLRVLAGRIGLEGMEQAVAEAGLPASKRRTYLDDLFVPVIDFYTWERLADMLSRHGLVRVHRWSKGRLDHEENLETYLSDLQGFAELFKAGRRSSSPALVARRPLFDAGSGICEAVIDTVRNAIKDTRENPATEPEVRQGIIGQGHHRVVAWKEGAR